MNAAQRFIKEVEKLTGCKYSEIPSRTLTECNYNYTGKVLASAGNLVLCEADQSYVGGVATGDPKDYVIVVNDLSIVIKPKAGRTSRLKGDLIRKKQKKAFDEWEKSLKSLKGWGKVYN